VQRKTVNQRGQITCEQFKGTKAPWTQFAEVERHVTFFNECSNFDS
jgi:hypothetical protein